WDAAVATLGRLAAAHRVELIAIGNGTASRETDKLAGDLISRYPQLTLTKAVVSEAGASVYSASAYASAELPGLDVSLRGAVSIARRLQDPLAELVKIDPKSIGVGQYQHDIAESALSRSLDAVVEDCVNAVGVDVNTASAPLLRRVSGITETLAAQIVAHRDAHGPFRTRTSLADVPRPPSRVPHRELRRGRAHHRRPEAGDAAGGAGDERGRVRRVRRHRRAPGRPRARLGDVHQVRERPSGGRQVGRRRAGEGAGGR